QNSSWPQTNRSFRRSTHRDWYCFCNILIIRIKELGQYSFHIQALLFIYSADFSFICSRKTCNVSVSFNASISSSLISPSPSSMKYTSTSFLSHSLYYYSFLFLFYSHLFSFYSLYIFTSFPIL